MNPVKCLPESIRNYKVHLAANNDGRFRLPNRAENIFKMGYDPDLDTSPELDPDASPFYLTVIGIQHWMIKLGMNDIITNVSLFLSHVALNRERKIDATVHVMAHVGQRYNF